MQLFAVLITLLPLVAGAPTSLVARDCGYIPSNADPNVVNQVYGITQQRGLDDRELLATFETAWVESHANNLNCGDQDSLGVFQQRPSQGWGSPDQCMDVNYATNKFIDQLVINAGRYPGYSAGQLAQSVQISEYPDRYDQAEGTARQLISQARGW